MKESMKVAIAALVAAMALGGASTAFAKAHDQGKADGTLVFPEATSAKDQIDFLTNLGALDGKGVSALQKNGRRGDISSTAKGDVRVVPVVNGKVPD